MFFIKRGFLLKIFLTFFYFFNKKCVSYMFYSGDQRFLTSLLIAKFCSLLCCQCDIDRLSIIFSSGGLSVALRAATVSPTLRLRATSGRPCRASRASFRNSRPEMHAERCTCQDKSSTSSAVIQGPHRCNYNRCYLIVIAVL